MCLLFTAFFTKVVLAEERIVQLTVPNCSSWNSSARIGAILKKIEGVKKHKNEGHDLLIITFNDEKTTINIIVNELKKGKFIVNGDPVYLK